MSRILDSFGRPYTGTNGTLPPIVGGERGSRLLRDGAYDSYALPQVLTFNAIFETGWRSYWHGAADEAYRFSPEAALAMRRDSSLMAAVNERRLAFTSLNWHLEIPDERDRLQTTVRDTLTSAIRGIPGFHRIPWALSDCIWYGRAAVQCLWRWTEVGGFRVLVPRKFSPINGDKISYMFDGTPCIAVFGAVTTDGKPGQPCTLTPAEQDQWARHTGDPYSLSSAHFVWTQFGKALVLDGTWRERFVIAQHELDDRDYQDADEAEAIFGRGIRDVLFALDWMKREWLGNISDYFERVGQGITLWYWDASNPASKAEVESAARDQSDRVNLLVPRWPDHKGNNSAGVERIEVPTAGSEFLLKLIELIDNYQNRYIIGQSLSHESSGGGFGGSIADLHSETKCKIAAQDAKNCEQALTGDPENPGLLSMMKDWSFPGLEFDFPVTFRFDLERSESKDKLDAAKTIVEMGIPTKADELRAVAGLSKPTDGDELVGGAGNNMFSQDPSKLFASNDELLKHSRDAAGHEHDEVGRFTGPGGSAQAIIGGANTKLRDIARSDESDGAKRKAVKALAADFGKQAGEHFAGAATDAKRELAAITGKPAERFGFLDKAAGRMAKALAADFRDEAESADAEDLTPLRLQSLFDDHIADIAAGRFGGKQAAVDAALEVAFLGRERTPQEREASQSAWELGPGYGDRPGNWDDLTKPYAYGESPRTAFDQIAARVGASKALALLAHAIKEKQLPLEGSSAGAKLRPMEGSAAFAELPLMTLLQLQRELGLTRYSEEQPKPPVARVKDVDLSQYMRHAEGIGFAASLEAASALAEQAAAK